MTDKVFLRIVVSFIVLHIQKGLFSERVLRSRKTVRYSEQIMSKDIILGYSPVLAGEYSPT